MGGVRPRRFGLLVNPFAGRGRAVEMSSRLAELLRNAGSVVRIFVGADRSESIGLAHNAVATGDVDVLVACGGDGLAHCAVRAVAHSSVALGLLPCGTGNDLARSLGVPFRSPAAAAAVLLTGSRRTIDLCRVENEAGPDELVSTVLATGLDALVAARAEQLKIVRGRLKYQLATAVEILPFRAIRYRLVMNPDEVQQGPPIPAPATKPFPDGNWEAMLVAIGNGPYYGGGMRMCPAAELTDGLLDITLVGAMSRRRLLRLFPTVYRGQHLRYPEVITARARSVTLQAESTPIFGDGELLGSLPITCTAVPGALGVLVPGQND